MLTTSTFIVRIPPTAAAHSRPPVRANEATPVRPRCGAPRAWCMMRRGFARRTGSNARVEMAGLLRRAIERKGGAVALTIDGETVEARAGDLLITAVLLH